MKQQVVKIWLFVLQNLDTLLAIILSAITAALGVWGGNINFLVSAIAGVLALLAYGIIKDRMARDDLLTKLQRIDNYFQRWQHDFSADSFFKTNSPESTLISQAKEEVWLIQESGSKIFQENFRFLENLIRTGGKVKLIICSDDRQIISLLALRSKVLEPENIISRQSEASRKFEVFFKSTRDSIGSFEVRQISYPLITPQYSLTQKGKI